MKLLQLLKKWFTIKEIYRCDYINPLTKKECNFKTYSKRGLEIHRGKMHKWVNLC